MTEPQETQHFLDYWRVILSRKEVVIATSLFIILASVVVTLSLPRIYLSSTRIAVRPDAPDIALQQQKNLLLGSGSYDPYFLRTQFEILQSRPILYEVIKNLRLHEHFGRIYNDTGAPLSVQDAYRILSKNMKVQQYRDTNLIEIRIYRSTRRSTRDMAREDATRIANEIAAVYRDQRMKINREEKARGVAALNEAYGKEQKRVEEAEKNVETIRKQLDVAGIASTPAGTLNTLDKERLLNLEADRIAARNNMLDRKTRLEEMEKLRGDPLLYSAAYLVKDQALASLREALNEGELKMRALEESYGAKHPEVVRGQAVVEDIKKKIDATLKGIQAGLQTDYEIARKSYEAIEADLSAARQSDISTHTERLLPFTKAEDELERRRQMRDSIEQRLVQERIELDLPRTPVEVIDPAEIPDENDPVSPNLLLNIILGIIVGLGAGVGLAFFIEYIDTSVKTVDDIERLVKAQILGVIPQKVRPLVEEGTESRHAEPYRVLRTNLQFSKKLGPGKAICLTSGGAGEGKSLTTFNLAFVYAQAGQKVLIVDSDLRRPTQHKMLKTVNTPGVTDVLLGKAQLADVIRHTGIPNLDFLPSGKMPSSAHGLLTIARMRELVAALKPQYDMLFFDTPPIMGVSDASIIASEVDGVLLVIQHRSYPRAVSIRAKTIVENVGGNLVGVVLNNINLNRDYYYYYYSYYYYGYGKERRSSGAREAASGPSAGAGQKAGTA